MLGMRSPSAASAALAALAFAIQFRRAARWRIRKRCWCTINIDINRRRVSLLPPIR